MRPARRAELCWARSSAADLRARSSGLSLLWAVSMARLRRFSVARASCPCSVLDVATRAGCPCYSVHSTISFACSFPVRYSSFTIVIRSSAGTLSCSSASTRSWSFAPPVLVVSRATTSFVVTTGVRGVGTGVGLDRADRQALVADDDRADLDVAGDDHRAGALVDLHARLGRQQRHGQSLHAADEAVRAVALDRRDRDDDVLRVDRDRERSRRRRLSASLMILAIVLAMVQRPTGSSRISVNRPLSMNWAGRSASITRRP